jgi:outer membrane protein, heavy metal efflux system
MRLYWSGLAALLAALPAAAQQADWKTQLSAAVERAVAKNPEIASRESRIEASRHRVGQALALPDPELEVGIQDVPPSGFSFRRDDFTMEKVTARQRFPGAGRRPAQKESAEAQLAFEASMHVDHIIRLAADVAEAFFTIGELESRIEIAERSRERLRRVAASAADRYRVGNGAQTDVLRANLELTSSEERLSGLIGEQRIAAARFNALQGLPADSPLPRIASPDDEPSIPEYGKVLIAAAASPRVDAAQAEIRVAEGMLSLARLERRPDLTAMAYYAHRVDFEDLVGASVALNLPFLQPKRLRERQAEREAEISGARADLETVRNEIRRAVEEAYANLTRSLEQTKLFRDSILPQAETNLNAAQEAYSVGRLDFSSFVRAAIDRDTYEGELAARRADAWRAIAGLQRASGVRLIPGTPSVGGNDGQ